MLSGIWALLNSHYSGQKDIVLTYPINARPSQIKDMKGCFVNTALMKIEVDQRKNVSEFIQSVGHKRKDAKPHLRIALSDIVQRLRVEGVYSGRVF